MPFALANVLHLPLPDFFRRTIKKGTVVTVVNMQKSDQHVLWSRLNLRISYEKLNVSVPSLSEEQPDVEAIEGGRESPTTMHELASSH